MTTHPSNQQPGSFDVTDQAEYWIKTLFAPWIQALNLRVVSAKDGRAELILPFSEHLCREGGTVCGQALMSAADTSMVFAIMSLFGEFRPTTTVSLNTSFMRAVAMGDVHIEATVRKPGRTMMFGNIDLTDPDGKLVAQSTTSYMMMS
ncbi:MAG: PaaI family thioesterase [Burkholderiaceae bacterium]